VQTIATPGPVRVVGWHLATFRRLWKANVLSTFIQPMLYLLGLGVGVGSLVDRHSTSSATLGTTSYVAYVAPGMLITVAMSLGANESLWPIMGNLKWQRGYHGLAATPLEARDIVLGHALWIAIRSAIAAVCVAVALACFPQTRAWGLAPSVLVSMVVGVSFAMPIMAYSIVAKEDSRFAALNRFFVIPLFLFGGAFYPISKLPTAVQWYARFAPLWHGVVVARSFTSGHAELRGTIGHLAYLGLWILVGCIVAVHNLRKKLYP
jgi:lipooligosaccharide transport system permease protein